MQQRSIASQAEADLIRFIARSGFKPGDALPGEMELSQQLGLSRTSLREALSVLRQTGLVTTARRRGMRLARPMPFLPLERLTQGGVDADTVDELCELRLMVEVGASSRLCQKVSMLDIEDLREMCRSERAAIGDFDRLRAIDRALHARLLAISGNRQVAHLHGILLIFFDTPRYRASFEVWRGRNQPMQVDHGPLIDALADRDAVRLAALMEKHLAVHLAPQPPVAES